MGPHRAAEQEGIHLQRASPLLVEVRQAVAVHAEAQAGDEAQATPRDEATGD
jgi:hypothetical protein